MGMALSGLASGFDWKSIVDQLIEVSRAPQNRMRTDKSANSQKSSALTEIQGKLASLKTSVASLNSPDSLLKKSATIADKTSNWTATATKDTPAGDYNVEMISQATATVLRGKQNIGQAINANVALSTISVGRAISSGFFTINGKTISVDPATESLQDIISKINDPVVATGVTAVYLPPDDNDPNLDLVELSSVKSINLGSSGDTSNFLQVMRLYGNGSNYVITDYATNPLNNADPTDSRYNGLGVINLGVPPGSSSSNIKGANTIHPNGGSSYFEVNGVRIDFISTTTTQEILDKITASAAGVSATYDSKFDQIVLQNKNPGNKAIHVTSDGPGNFALVLGLVNDNDLKNKPAQSLGQNATFRINGGAVIQSQSSVLTETDHGIKGLTINANSLSPSLASVTKTVIATYPPAYNGKAFNFPLGSGITTGMVVSGAGISPGTTVLESKPLAGGDYVVISSTPVTPVGVGTSLVFTNSYTPTKITVAGDTSAAKDALNAFVAKYNDVQDTIEKYTKVTTTGGKVTSSILSGNTELSSISRKLRAELTKSSGLSGTINRLSDLGVSSSGIQNTISFNSSVLDAKLASATDDVTNFFKDSTATGFLARFKTNFLDKLVTDAGSATGGLQAQLSSITKQNTSLDKQIAEVDRRLAAQRATLEASFIAMEKSQSQYQQQGSYLAKTFSNK